MSKYYYLKLTFKEAVDLFRANDERKDIRVEKNGKMVIVSSIRDLYIFREYNIYSRRLTEGQGWKEIK